MARDQLSSLFLRKMLETALLLVLGVLVIVTPNAFKEVMALSLSILAVLYFRRIARVPRTILVIYSISALLTLFYLLIGVWNGAPEEAVRQVIIIYIFSPLLWIAAINGAMISFGTSVIIRWIIALGILGVASQAFFVWAFLNNAFLDLITLLSVDPNVHYADGYFGVAMFVFGALIFVSGAIFAAPEVIKSLPLRSLVLIIFGVSALTSGRSALILAVFVGLLIAFFPVRGSITRRASGMLFSFIGIPLMAYLAIFYLYVYAEIDVGIAVSNLWFKLANMGGDIRAEYAPLLLLRAAESFFLGSGHGIGVEIVVNESFPWRYEIIALATLHRVGLIGLFVYSLPIIIALYFAAHCFFSGRLSPEGRFVLGGFASSVIAASTNPYIEAVVFQWMYIFPVLYFFALRARARAREG